MRSIYDLRSVVGNGDALIIIPPFAGIDRPSLGAHLLQAYAKLTGFRVCVFYANLTLAQVIGEKIYEMICYSLTSALLGERFFAATAYGLPPFGRDAPIIETVLCDPTITAALSDLPEKMDLSPEAFHALEAKIGGWVEAVSTTIAECRFPIVGCSTTFEQTAASVAILNRVKSVSPSTITILGGANCEGEMAEGILSLRAKVDYVFSGESEVTFSHFLSEVLAGQLPIEKIIRGKLSTDLNSLPTPDFGEFFQQRDCVLPGSIIASNDVVWLPYEGSRGCWWGEKHQCTFCGINGLGMQYREKSADRVINELHELTERHGVRRVCMVDNIMPYRFFQTLLPRLGDEVPSLQMFYEQKANLSLDQVGMLKKAGVAIVQPGIEALSTELLRLMGKGVTARQNIASLRFARSVDIHMNWNLLYGFPSDNAEDYRRTLTLLPSLRHLEPPLDFCRLSIDRFSPYFCTPSKYGVRNLRPMDGYSSVLPDGADVFKIAYHFIGDYDSGSLSDTDLLNEIEAEINTWKNAWNTAETAPPTLSVVQLSPDYFVLVDTRGLSGTVPIHFLNREQATAALVPHPSTECDEAVEWTREHWLAVEFDGWHTPLATATPTLLCELEKDWHARVR